LATKVSFACAPQLESLYMENLPSAAHNRVATNRPLTAGIDLSLSLQRWGVGAATLAEVSISESLAAIAVPLDARRHEWLSAR
jgi:hypothetical protein